VMASLLGEAISRGAQPKAQTAPLEAVAMQSSLPGIASQGSIPAMEPPPVLQPTFASSQSGLASSIWGLISEALSRTREPLEWSRRTATRLAGNPTLLRAYDNAASYIGSIKLPDIRSIRLAYIRSLRLPERRELDQALSVLTTQAARVPYYKRWVAVTVVLLTAWVALREHRPTTVAPNSAVTTSNASAQREPSLLAGATSEPTKAVPEVAAPIVPTRPHWVRVGSSELDYVGDDVTVRYFGVKPAPRHAPAQSRVKKIGSDVTVRYFTPIAASSQEQMPSTQIHYVSDESSAPKRIATPTLPHAVE
jgi:hypothetical protein